MVLIYYEQGSLPCHPFQEFKLTEYSAFIWWREINERNNGEVRSSFLKMRNIEYDERR